MRLEELREIILEYDNFYDCWMSGMDADEYAEKFDELRNRGLEIIKELQEKA